MKRIISLLISTALIFSICVACTKSPNSNVNKNIQADGQILQTTDTFENEDMTFEIPVNWEVTQNGYVSLHKIPEDEYDETPYIDFNVMKLSDSFLSLPNQEIVFTEYQYKNYEVYENRVANLNGREVHVLRYKATMLDENSTVAYIKLYTFNDSSRTYSMALTSPKEDLGIDEFYTTYCSFKGKEESDAEPTTSETDKIEYPYLSGDFNAVYPTGWISDPTGNNPRVKLMQYWLDKSFNFVPVFVSNKEVDGFYPYISVLMCYQDIDLLKGDDASFDFSDSFNGYEQGAIERSKRGDYDVVTLNFSALNEDNKRIYVKQILFNTDERLVIMSLYAPNQEFAVEEFTYMYDTIVIN